MNDNILLGLAAAGLILLGFWLTRSPRPRKTWQEIEQLRAAHAYIAAVAAHINSSLANQGRGQLIADANGQLASMETSLGRVVLTRDAIVFLNANVPWGRVNHVEVLPDAFIVYINSGGAIRIGFTEHNLEFAKVLITQANLAT